MLALEKTLLYLSQAPTSCSVKWGWQCWTEVPGDGRVSGVAFLASIPPEVCFSAAALPPVL